MDFKDFDVEIQNIHDSDPEHFNGKVSVAGTPVVITPTNARPIMCAFIQNPGKGPNSNPANAILLYSIDGINYVALGRNESMSLPGMFTSLYIDATVNNTNYEIIIWS